MLWIGTFAVLSSALVGAVFLWRQFDDLGGLSDELDSEIAAARRVGIAVTSEDLAAKYAVPDSENAALAYKAVLGDWQKVALQAAPGSLYDRAQRILDGNRAGLQEYLEVSEESPCIDRAAAAAKLPGCFFDGNYDNGIEALRPELSNLRRLAKIIVARAIARSSVGNAEGCVDDIHTTLRIGRHLMLQPDLLSQLTGMSIEAIALQGVELSGQSLRTNPKALASMQGVLGEVQPARLAAAVDGETVMMLSSLRTLAREDGIPYTSSRHWQAGACLMLRLHRAVLSELTSGQPSVQIGHRIKELQAESARGFSLSRILMRRLQIPWSTAVRGLLYQETRISVSRCFVAGLELLRETGQLPVDIDQLPGDHQDPFTGKPLRIARVGGKWRVYSLGPDGKDSGGERSNKDGQDDICDEIPIPQQ